MSAKTRNLRRDFVERLITLGALLIVGCGAGSAQMRTPVFSPNQQPECRLITITRDGIRPTQITRKEGPFILRVENRSDLQEITVSIAQKANPKALVQKRHTRANADSTQLIDPEPGEYNLFVNERPEWSFKLIVNAK